MAMNPRQRKFRKDRKGKMTGLSKRGNFPQFGDYCMKVLDRGWITGKQIEACRVAINRSLGRKGKLWICIFPDKPITKKPLEVRMGKGKGSVDRWGAVVRPGKILFELANVTRDQARDAFKLASDKLALSTKFVERLHTVR